MAGFADDVNWFDPMCEHGVSKTNEKCHECEKKAEEAKGFFPTCEHEVLTGLGKCKKCEAEAAEFRSIAPMSPELQAAATEFLRLATVNNCSFVGMLIRVDDPPLISVVGNVIETGGRLAQLFRMYAEIIEERGDVIQIDVTPRK